MSTGDTLALLRGRDNSIGFLRLCAALAVVVGHSFPYGGYGQDVFLALTHNQVGPGRVAVDVFFLLSGFLIAASWVRRGSPSRFLWHRFLRIFPAYWVCILVTGLVVAPIVGGGVDLGYIGRNMLLLVGQDFTVDGMSEAVNGALWTLPWELRAYLLVAALGALGLLRRVPVVAGLFVASWALFVAAIFTYPGEATSPAVTSGSRLFTFFLAGTLAYLLRDRIALRRDWFVLSVVLMVAAIVVGWGVDYSGGVFYAAAPVPLTYATLYLALRLPAWCQRINAGWDYSYGIYIYGTMALVVLDATGANHHGWLPYLAATLVVTIAAAALSWHLIERPALRLKGWPSSSRRAVEGSPAATTPATLAQRRRDTSPVAAAGVPAPPR